MKYFNMDRLFFFFSALSSGNGSKTKHTKKSKLRNNSTSTRSNNIIDRRRGYSRSPSPSLSSATSSASRISRDELEYVLQRLGGFDGDEIADILKEVCEIDGMIDLDGITACTEKDDDNEELLAAFRVFDSNGDGRISPEELQCALCLMGDRDCSVEDCRRMIGGVDSDGDGFVSFGDFARMMTTS